MKDTLAAAWTLAVKDLKSIVRDRTALVLTILVPIALVSVFGWIMAYAFGGSGGMPKVRLHVVDFSQTDASREFIDALRATDMLRVKTLEIETDTIESESQPPWEAMVRDGDASHVLLIPDDYEQAAKLGETPDFEMIRDPGRQMEDRIVQIGLMQAMAGELGGSIFSDAMEKMLTKQGMAPESVQAVRDRMDQIGETIGDFAEEKEGSSDQSESDSQTQVGDKDSDDQGGGANGLLDFMSEAAPITTNDIEPPSRPKQVTYQQAQSVAGMSVMMLLFALTSAGSVLLVEREEGTLKRLFANPISRHSVLLGKYLFVVVVGLVQLAILFTYGEWMFRVGLFRDPITLLVLSVTWVMTGGAFGMFLATVSRSTKQAESLASLLILMMAALGGCWFPLQMMNLPTVLDTVCKSTMTYWAMTGFQGMLWNQLPWYSAKTLTAIGFQLTWAAALASLSVWFFRRHFCRG